jgi:hypothetical protein
MKKETKESWQYVLISLLIISPFYITFLFKDYIIHGYLLSLILGLLNYCFTKKNSFLYIHKPYYISLFIITTNIFILQKLGLIH